MIAPSFWIDPKTGNDYMLTVQYPESQVKTLADLSAIPLRGAERIRSHTARHGEQHPPHRFPHRGGPLSASPHHRHLRTSAERRPGQDRRLRSTRSSRRRQFPTGLRGQPARHGAGHARFVPELLAWADSRGGFALPDSGCAVPVVRRSVHHSAGRTAGRHRRHPDPAAHGHHAERDVADGRRDAGGHRRFEQHPDRRVHPPACANRAWLFGKQWLPPAGSVCGRC